MDIKTRNLGRPEGNGNESNVKVVNVHTENSAKESAEKKQESKEKGSAKQ